MKVLEEVKNKNANDIKNKVGGYRVLGTVLEGREEFYKQYGKDGRTNVDSICSTQRTL